MDIFKNATHFIWDKDNKDKNWIKHKVTFTGCEEVFFNEPVLVLPDTKHSKVEKRWYALGQTNAKRKLFLVFTIRKQAIRVISARDMNNKERKKYEKIKTNS